MEGPQANLEPAGEEDEMRSWILDLDDAEEAALHMCVEPGGRVGGWKAPPPPSPDINNIHVDSPHNSDDSLELPTVEEVIGDQSGLPLGLTGGGTPFTTHEPTRSPWALLTRVPRGA